MFAAVAALLVASGRDAAIYGQSLPKSCQAIAHNRPDVRLRTRSSWNDVRGMELKLVAAQQSLISDSMQVIVLGRLRTNDSTAFDEALARIAVDSYNYGFATNFWAASFYRRIVGRAEPMLATLETNGFPSGRHLALSAITTVLDGPENELVFLYACDAAWQLSAFQAEPEYAATWFVAPDLQWPVQAEAVIREAARLSIGGHHAADIEVLMTTHVPAGIGFQRE